MTGVLGVLVGAKAGLIVSISPSSLSKAGTGSQTTAAATASVIGGIAPYTYAWGTLGIATANTPSASSTTFTATVSPGNPIVENGSCQVTDSVGNFGAASIPVNFTA